MLILNLVIKGLRQRAKKAVTFEVNLWLFNAKDLEFKELANFAFSNLRKHHTQSRLDKSLKVREYSFVHCCQVCQRKKGREKMDTFAFCFIVLPVIHKHIVGFTEHFIESSDKEVAHRGAISVKAIVFFEVSHAVCVIILGIISFW